MTTPIPVIIDTDPGVDDAIALLLALRAPELNVVGITTVFGNVSVEKTTGNACRVLDLLDKPLHAPPVVRGSSGPLVRSFRSADHVHGTDGLGDSELPATDRSTLDHGVVPFILEHARAYAGELQLISLGPLTNMARVLAAAAEPAQLFAHLTAMGGAVTVPGNRTPVAEFNVMSDPEAAEIVFRSGVPLTLVGLDVTYQAIFGHRELGELAERRPDPAVDFVHRVVRGYVDFYREHQGLEGAALHDPVAVAAVIQPDIIQTERWHIAAETQGKLTSGMVVADRRYRPAYEPNANIALELDYGAFRKLLMGHLSGANQNEKA